MRKCEILLRFVPQKKVWEMGIEPISLWVETAIPVRVYHYAHREIAYTDFRQVFKSHIEYQSLSMEARGTQTLLSVLARLIRERSWGLFDSMELQKPMISINERRRALTMSYLLDDLPTGKKEWQEEYNQSYWKSSVVGLLDRNAWIPQTQSSP